MYTYIPANLKIKAKQIQLSKYWVDIDSYFCQSWTNITFPSKVVLINVDNSVFSQYWKLIHVGKTCERNIFTYPCNLPDFAFQKILITN